ncbi:hypothetical protein ACI8AF_07660 [Blastococcus sp. SYSU D00669]
MTGDSAAHWFAGEPQPVEVFHRGTWYSGELLGWRFAESGLAVARVRCVVDGLRHKAWKPLTDLRLPLSEPPVVLWAPLPRHESAAPARTLPAEDDETRPHALLIGSERPRRPAVPRPRTAEQPRWMPAHRWAPTTSRT